MKSPYEMPPKVDLITSINDLASQYRSPVEAFHNIFFKNSKKRFPKDFVENFLKKITLNDFLNMMVNDIWADKLTLVGLKTEDFFPFDEIQLRGENLVNRLQGLGSNVENPNLTLYNAIQHIISDYEHAPEFVGILKKLNDGQYYYPDPSHYKRCVDAIKMVASQLDQARDVASYVKNRAEQLITAAEKKEDLTGLMNQLMLDGEGAVKLAGLSKQLRTSSQVKKTSIEKQDAEYYLIKMPEIDPALDDKKKEVEKNKLLSLRNMTLLTEDKPCYLLLDSEVYYVFGKHTPITLLSPKELHSMFPSELSKRIPATPEQLTEMRLKTGYIPKINIPNNNEIDEKIRSQRIEAYISEQERKLLSTNPQDQSELLKSFEEYNVLPAISQIMTPVIVSPGTTALGPSGSGASLDNASALKNPLFEKTQLAIYFDNLEKREPNRMKNINDALTRVLSQENMTLQSLVDKLDKKTFKKGDDIYILNKALDRHYYGFNRLLNWFLKGAFPTATTIMFKKEIKKLARPQETKSDDENTGKNNSPTHHE